MLHLIVRGVKDEDLRLVQEERLNFLCLQIHILDLAVDVKRYTYTMQYGVKSFADEGSRFKT